MIEREFDHSNLKGANPDKATLGLRDHVMR
ncbi:hypothetical protein Mame_04743 (plasmid) [Martelella mediterranea DSM 17316]|uniref:Uncharacterized protein n=1 Tax=Martelella mediterranea DSM 17316 TaxID=1122214 RepID=A0A1U9Z8L4_9HYPH|nr:hypothetical protein Mame_04743 [Martelella mediterranea DSM 17316]